jgi:hypothetical protein
MLPLRSLVGRPYPPQLERRRLKLAVPAAAAGPPGERAGPGGDSCVPAMRLMWRRARCLCPRAARLLRPRRVVQEQPRCSRGPRPARGGRRRRAGGGGPRAQAPRRRRDSSTAAGQGRPRCPAGADSDGITPHLRAPGRSGERDQPRGPGRGRAGGPAVAQPGGRGAA